MMNSPARLATQRWMDVRLFKRHCRGLQGRKALEMGIGRGRGMGLILEHFGPRAVDGFDLDPDMVVKAAHYLKNKKGQVWVGDACHMPVKTASYSAVFDFGIIHHIPNWQQALAETARVLEPGGRFFSFEMLSGFIDHPLSRALLDHPQQERFDHAAYCLALQQEGFRLIEHSHLGQVCGWYVAERQQDDNG
ncbi:MAG: methyltransferase domain-containing protein [Magnetococcales bacterium]|nr:methyltransferase domain-containing protein [Magnetococcales bacterium]